MSRPARPSPPTPTAERARVRDHAHDKKAARIVYYFAKQIDHVRKQLDGLRQGNLVFERRGE